MSYATLQQLIDRSGAPMLVRLTDRDEVATGEIDEPTVDRALTDAQAMIDGYLKVRYSLPLAVTPPVVTDLELSIAIYKLHTAAPDPKIEQDYKDALKMLRDLSSGAMRLDVAGIEPAGSGGSGVRITDRERPLTAENMKGFI